MTDIKDKLTEAATSLSESASGVAEDLQTRAEDAWDSLKDQADSALHVSSAYVRENAISTALAAMGVGLVIGLALSHRRPVSLANRYLEEPLHKSKGVLLGLLLAFGTLLKRSLSSASSVAEGLAEDVGHEANNSVKSLKNAARRIARRSGV